MARGYSTARSESALRSLGGGSDEIAAYRAARRLDKEYLGATKELRSLIKDKRVYIGDELTAFIDSKNLELSKVNAQDGNFYKEVARITKEIETKVAKTRAEFGVLGAVPIDYPRQDKESLRRYYNDTMVQMAYVKGPGDTKASVGKQVFIISDQLRKGDTFTFEDKNGNKVKVDSVGAGKPLKDVPNFDAGLDMGTDVYILREDYFKRGE
jgi:hypothetical protein